jgi:hypothetical protein
MFLLKFLSTTDLEKSVLFTRTFAASNLTGWMTVRQRYKMYHWSWGGGGCYMTSALGMDIRYQLGTKGNTK